MNKKTKLIIPALVSLASSAFATSINVDYGKGLSPFVGEEASTTIDVTGTVSETGTDLTGGVFSATTTTYTFTALIDGDAILDTFTLTILGSATDYNNNTTDVTSEALSYDTGASGGRFIKDTATFNGFVAGSDTMTVALGAFSGTGSLGNALQLDSFSFTQFGVEGFGSTEVFTITGSDATVTNTAGQNFAAGSFGDSITFSVGAGSILNPEYYNFSMEVSSIPEPGAFALIAGSLALGFVMVRRRK
ncbi:MULTISPECIES: PEP-CTERM sorting domain-containing protein [unclassified Lentimonas]|uniref:PEP-CTERM sorting domain-containing protein n=1 Tax=unclassified Lentimonas TaxID=2630993 RepID=UPI00132A56E4|nr:MULTISPECIES: PEP-CTERM sorting domain-containing protein [unclassified Lentimonas]CAA6690713.1 Unannotated [Lentimonas sp. CC19]CAA6693345.1 Unannotated [Lentimonas sp. CC10]CAA7071823.1 Unannotated [Lentimonas sp. CC11]